MINYYEGFMFYIVYILASFAVIFSGYSNFGLFSMQMITNMDQAQLETTKNESNRSSAKFEFN